MSDTKPAADVGVECPKCGCRHLPTVYTRRKGAFTVRLRECRNCGKRFQTREKVVGATE